MNAKIQPRAESKKKRSMSFHARKMASTRTAMSSAAEGGVELKTTVGEIYDFLSGHHDILKKDAVMMKEFETLVHDELKKLQGMTVLHTIMKDHGWTGRHFNFSRENKLEEAKLLQILGTLMMTRSEQTEFADDNSIIKSFIPDTIIQLLAASKRSGEGQSAVRRSFYGSCMLVDISGFTKLSAALCTQGSSGLDKLHSAISGYLGKCVEIVYQYGGDVISFAGDAIICIFVHEKGWEEKNHSFRDRNVQEESTFNGDSAAIQSFNAQILEAANAVGGAADDNMPVFDGSPTERPMQRQGSNTICAPFPAVETRPPANSTNALNCAMILKEHCTETLTAHVAISCGDMVFTSLGGCENEWIYMVVGTCINEIGYCIEDAKSKQCVITEQTYQNCLREFTKGEVIDCYVMPSGNRFITSVTGAAAPKEVENRLLRISNAPTLITTISKFVPGPVLDSLLNSNFKNISELREVTTMFIKLDTFDPATMVENVPMLQEFFFMCQGVLHESGGFMRQFLIDDKGCVLIAMWGTPAFTHTNNCSRAIYAAIGISTKAHSIENSKVSIGITTGAVYCGPVGSMERRDYVGIGSKVNMSARLMGKAKGRVLIDMETYHHLPIDSRSKLILSEAFQLKGLEGDTYSYSVPLDGSVMPTLSNTDDADGSVDSVMIQKDISASVSQQLNSLADVDGEHHSHSPSSYAGGNTASFQGAAAFNHDGKPTGDVSLVGKVGNILKSLSSKGKPVDAPGKQYQHIQVMPMVDEEASTKEKSLSVNAALVPHVSVSLIQGSAGSGKMTVANFFRRGALSRGLRCSFVVCRNPDHSKPLGVINKLLLDLIPAEDLATEELQKVTLMNLVSAVCPAEDPNYLLSTNKSLQQAFGYAWLTDMSSAMPFSTAGMTPKSSVAVGSPSYGEEGADGNVIVPKTDEHLSKSIAMSRKVKAEPTTGPEAARKHDNRVLDLVLTLLLQKTPTCVAFVNAHFADELSWMVVKRMLDYRVHMAMIVTVLSKPPPTVAEAREALKKVSSQGGENNVSIQMTKRSSATNTKYVNNPAFFSFRDNAKCRVHDMRPLGFAEVEFVLNYAYGKHTEPSETPEKATKELVNTVLEISNGNPFWCKSIADFVMDQGIEEFMKSIAQVKKKEEEIEDVGGPGKKKSKGTKKKVEEDQSNPLHVLVICRFEKLTQALQIVIKHACIIGSEFDIPTLEACLPKAASKDVEGSVELLLESSFILAVDVGEEAPVFVFQNNLIRDALYLLTPPR